jgi:hypothetical protein
MEDRCGVLASIRMPRPILLVSAATRARRVPEPAVVVGAVVGVRSVLRKLVGADGGARFGAARSKHGEMNRKGPRESRLCFGAMCEQSTRGGWGTIRLGSHTWDIRNAHIPSECAHPTVRLARVCALLCMRFARVRVW